MLIIFSHQESKITLKIYVIPAIMARLIDQMTAYAGEDVKLGKHSSFPGGGENLYHNNGNQ